MNQNNQAQLRAALTQRHQPRSQPGTSSTPSIWSSQGRNQVAVKREARTEAMRAVEMTKLRMLQSELRKREVGQMIANADELMDVALNLAGGDDGRLEVFVDIVLSAIRTEQRNFDRATNPLLRGYF